MDFLWILSCFFAVTVAEDFNIFAEPYSPEKYTNRRCCVAIQMIEAMRNGFNLFPYESAIRCEIDRHELFTQNQYEAMGCYDGLISRHKRNIVNPNGPNANLLWTNPQNIPYKIKPGFTDDQIANIRQGMALIEEKTSDEQIASIRQGMALIEEKTCIQFKEKDYSEVLFDHHIEVMYQDATCLSFVGMIGGSLGTAQQAQPIFLSAACLDFVKASHQFMHALGMWHENQRPDRDTYVKVDLNLIIPEERGNVVKLFPSLMTTLDTPYDYDSVMHAHPYENANGIDPPITTIDPRYQNRIGQRVEISFYNYYHLNQIYCKDTCGIIQPIRPCQNGGYQNPKKCTECLCKDGFGDVDCSKIAYDAGVMCPPDEIQMTGTGQVITSPGYDDAGSCDGTDKGCYPNKQRCTTLLKASPGNKVRVSFEGDFGMYCNMFGTLGTCYHWLEIRLGPDLTEIGERVCCYNTPSKVFVSEGEEILLLMRTNYTAPADKRRGFKLIAQEAGACDSVTCQNGGTCQGGLCTCADPYFGLNCENKQDFCAPNPCQNGGTCTDVGLSFVCECFPGLFGDRCELGTRDYCDPDPCNNNGVCVSLSTTFRCDCFTDYTGTTCDQQINQCASNPCINGGICIDGNGRFDCQCVNGYTGDICQFPPNTGCDNNPCATGATCVANGFSYTCTCPPGKEGTNCDRDTNECIPNPCIFGTCVDDFLDFDCVCRPGWEGRLCDQEIVDPCDSGPCQNGGLCNAIDDGTYTCTCQNGWMGDNCDRDIDECASTPCQNGGYCINGRDKYECFCFGSTGTNCENDIDECASNPCQNGATCNNLINMYTCTCVAGTRGTNCQTNVDDCSPNPCQNGGVCNDLINGYRCTCPPGTAGTNCETDIDDCSPNPCQNGGACIDRLNGYDYIDDCSPNPCQNGGACIDRLNGYDCDCLPGTAGDNCELNANDCNPNPCQNGGTCTDRINGYQCTCPAGTEGINCQINIDDCNPSPCQNGGVCIDLLNAYRCICPDGTQGFNCETNVDECNSNPCQNEGTCFDNVGGYECLCLPGTGGKNCENDAFDDCTPNPCQNNGQCVDKIGGYDCICPPGTNGNNCQINLDECASGPCLNGGTCVDGLNIYSCQCASGYSGVHCEIEDYVDPCLGVQCENGGQCVDENGVAICQCLPGYTREFCQTEVNECESQPCLHQGTCTDRVNGYECTCATGYSGVNCEIVTTDPCDPHPCNLGQCYSWGQIPFCFCPDSYEGRYCEILKTTVGTTTTSTTSTSTTTSTTTKKPTTTGRPAGLCGDKPCLNGGTCEDEGNKFSCRCPEPFFGPLCEENKNTANCGACREHLGMSQRPCYSEKRIPFRQRYIVRNIEDYCYMFLGHRICEYRTEQMCLKEYYERTPFCCGDTRYGTAELTGNINGYETCRVHGFSEFSSCQRYGHYGRQRMRYRSEFTYYTYTDYRCDPPYPIKMACTYTNWYNC